jgi:hypothetical protein
VSESEGFRLGKKEPILFKTWEVRVPMPAKLFPVKIAQQDDFRGHTIFFLESDFVRKPAKAPVECL